MVRSCERFSCFPGSNPAVFDPSQPSAINFSGAPASRQGAQKTAMNDYQTYKQEHHSYEPVDRRRTGLPDFPAESQNPHKHDNPGIARPDVFAMKVAGLCFEIVQPAGVLLRG